LPHGTPAAILLVALSAGTPADPRTDALAAIETDDYARGMELLLPLAETGHPEAGFRIGMMYENGLGVPRDLKKAEEWYNRVCPTK
jgi:TPR repeat protein